MRGMVFIFFMTKLSVRLPRRGTFLVIFRKKPGLSSAWPLLSSRVSAANTRIVRDLMLLLGKWLLCIELDEESLLNGHTTLMKG